ncbi:MAG: carbon starvation CstA family protein [Chthoniobacteraceae bacterium]|nr:carbon starvation CstA family protein [Chthoniobacteraceae bacterium]
MKNILQCVLWTSIALAGAASVGVVAVCRGEPINTLWLVTAALCVAAISYRFYGKWLETKIFVVNRVRATPAIVHGDGKDFVKTHPWMVFGHHFAAIAGPGPLVGPVLAAQFGYLPGVLWLLVGAALGGAVQDSLILFCSVRRGGKSLGQMVREEVGTGIGFLAMTSILAIMVIILAVLALVVVKALAESPWGLFTIAMTIPLAIMMGLANRFLGVSVTGVTIFGVIGLLLSVWGGQYLHALPALEAWFAHDKIWLAWAVIFYGFIASTLPMWLLLTPRDYLSTFLKLGAVAALVLAIVLLRPVLHMPAVTSFIDGSGLVFAGPVFPFVCITIACGAVSGFHALISSGTTPKILDSERGIRPIGYGAMVTEMVVAVMAIVAACAMEPGQYFAINTAIADPLNAADQAAVVQKVSSLTHFPLTKESMDSLAAAVGEKTMFGRAGGAPTFAVGMAGILSKAFASKQAQALWYHFAIMFEALFILTTIDAGTRVGRFLLQDLLGGIWRPLGNTGSWTANAFSSTLLVSAWGWFLYNGVVDPNGGVNSLWPIFGIANQLLSVIAFCLGTTVLLKMGHRRALAITLVPLIFLTWATFDAGWTKIASPDPRLGFLAAASSLQSQAAPGLLSPGKLKQLQALIFNARLDAAVTGGFLVMVAAIILGSLRVWWQILRGTRSTRLSEEPPVLLSEQEGVGAGAMQ